MPSYYQSTHSLSVAAPPEKIYQALTHWVERAAWRHGIGIEWEGVNQAFVGQKVRFKFKNLLFTYSFSFRVSGLEPPRRIYLEYIEKPLQGRGAIEINPEEGGCRVEFHWMKVEPAGLLSRLYFALGLGMWAHRTRTQETLRMLKQHFEKATD